MDDSPAAPASPDASGGSPGPDADASAGAKPGGASPAARLARLGLLVLALVIASELLGVRERMSDAASRRAAVEELRGAMQSTGALGALLFVVAFCVGELLHIPGLVFVAAGVLAYGRAQGGALSYAAGILSMTFSFLIVRGVSGQALAEIDRPWLKRAMAWVDARPVLTIAALRTVLVLSPPLNYALALTRVRLRDYVLGSAIGLIPPMLVAVLAFEWLLSWAL
jgi:uncharacterized membrane protein YdjX (TVP38/TMEM64 family)